MRLYRSYLSPGMLVALVCVFLIRVPVQAQQTPTLTGPQQTPGDTARAAYFIDGYHGGIYGHIPLWQTKFMVEKLNELPDWKINLELEPESWDSIVLTDPADYAAFKALIADQSADGRIEYINPAYGQSYLYNISGESIIRQFYYGMRKLRQHFPGLVFSTYSSEEPCFTSALPQILRSYGFKYASLKNPNTCWGGYTRAFGGELVNWVGPDGSSVLTVPRYAIESLKPHSTWETIASNNSLAYVLSAFKAGIDQPVGMCLQDAGWANGPWIKPGETYRRGSGDDEHDFARSYHPTVFETWRGYFEKHTPLTTNAMWHFTQEDVLTSLVWGGQVLQQVAREVRATENKLVVAEKLASIAAVYKGMPWPGASFDEAWRKLLLSQHHDCWIVPYNQLRGTTSTWYEWVGRWTADADGRADSILDRAMTLLTSASASSAVPGPGTILAAGSTLPAGVAQVTVFNPTAAERDENVEVALPAGWTQAAVTDARGKTVVCQYTDSGKLLFHAGAPSLGCAVYDLHPAQPVFLHRGLLGTVKNGNIEIETGLYSIEIDGKKGGAITKLVTKANGKDFVDKRSRYYLNELRGNFYREGGFHSSTETPAAVRMIENGPLRVRVQIDGHIAGTPYTQLITVSAGEPRIDIHLHIHWTGDHKIGESPDSIGGHPLKKEFYNDSFKLQALFPVALSGQKIYKSAPFDVLQSGLANTFFDSWDSIKNVVVLGWVDVTDDGSRNGLAVFSDETTSYAHGPDYPLALTVQYSGPGLFGRDYSITGPTTMDYAILPHGGRWDQARLWTAATRYNEPLVVKVDKGQSAGTSLLHLGNPGWEVSSITVSGNDLLVRLFNAEGIDSTQRLYPGFPVKVVNEVTLDGHIIKQLTIDKNNLVITAPRFGIRTIQFKDVLK